MNLHRLNICDNHRWLQDDLTAHDLSVAYSCVHMSGTYVSYIILLSDYVICAWALPKPCPWNIINIQHVTKIFQALSLCYFLRIKLNLCGGGEPGLRLVQCSTWSLLSRIPHFSPSPTLLGCDGGLTAFHEEGATDAGSLPGPVRVWIQGGIKGPPSAESQGWQWLFWWRVSYNDFA